MDIAESIAVSLILFIAFLLLLYSTKHQNEYRMLHLVEKLKADGWFVILKAMPDECGYTIPGSRSEYDAPHPDREVWHGKWVCQATDLKYRYSGQKYRGSRETAGDSALEAVENMWKTIHGENLELS